MAVKEGEKVTRSEHGVKKGVAVFSNTSFAEGIDTLARMKGIDNDAFVPDQDKQLQDRNEGINENSNEAQIQHTRIHVFPKSSKPGCKNVNLTLKREPVRLPGISCGVLEYPYAYVTHSIVHWNVLKDFI